MADRKVDPGLAFAFSSILSTMLSFRNVSLYLLATLASISITTAAPAPHDLEVRCDTTCQASSKPVPVIIADVQAQIGSKCDQISEKCLPYRHYLSLIPFNAGSMTVVTADVIAPIVADIKVVIDGAAAQIQAYIDAQVDVDIAVGVSVDVVVGLIVSLCAVCISLCV